MNDEKKWFFLFYWWKDFTTHHIQSQIIRVNTLLNSIYNPLRLFMYRVQKKKKKKSRNFSLSPFNWSLYFITHHSYHTYRHTTRVILQSYRPFTFHYESVSTKNEYHTNWNTVFALFKCIFKNPLILLIVYISWQYYIKI